ncbi:MAG: diaminopimelate epimerase [Acidobacteriaceae bacterium]|jgi:diaminopimelate epimerase|nr:diaminopimelate epimerase [Acidobacteriaceae bacterium]
MIPFAKAHAYGNDFLYIEERFVTTEPLDRLARAICHRLHGVGADGLIVYRRTDAGASMRLLNADGSRAEVSGNGVRALAALLARNQTDTGITLTIDTEGGIKILTRTGVDGSRQTFRADMGEPAGIAVRQIEAGGEVVTLVVLNMGNPQAIVLGPLPDDERFARLGAALERHPAFPEGTNVEFVQLDTPSRARIRIWERGVGPTTSSGTGSCASWVAAAAHGGANRAGEVIAPGGAQWVDWTGPHVILTGWAEVICDGQWYPSHSMTR